MIGSLLSSYSTNARLTPVFSGGSQEKFSQKVSARQTRVTALRLALLLVLLWCVVGVVAFTVGVVATLAA